MTLCPWTIPHVSVHYRDASPTFVTEVSPANDDEVQHSNPTTGFLTATTFIYALGAGITAAAGTRLALQWLLNSVY